MEYWRVYDKFAGDPTLRDVTETQNVTTGTESSAIRAALMELRESGQRSLGGWTFRGVVIGSPSVSDDPRTIEITYCVDRTQLQVVDVETGASAFVEPLQNLNERAVLEEGADGVWRVSERQNEVASC